MMSSKVSINRLFSIIEEKLCSQNRVVIVLEGNAASGKSSFGERLKNKYQGTLIHVDDFYKKRDKNVPLDLENNCEGNIDYHRLKGEIIDKLNESEILYKKFNCSKQDFEKEEIVPLNKLIIIEGTYALNPRLGKYYDLSIFIQVDDELQIERIKKRNPNNYDSFIKTWVKLERNYFSKFDILNKCDYLIEGINLI